MNIPTPQQKNTLVQGVAIFVLAIGLVTAAHAANAIPSTFAIQSETLLAFAQGIIGA
jgi:hypothetical protein